MNRAGCNSGMNMEPLWSSLLSSAPLSQSTWHSGSCLHGGDSTTSNLLKTSLWYKTHPWLKGRKHCYRSISDKQDLWIEVQILDEEEEVKPGPYVENWLGISSIHVLKGYNVMETIGWNTTSAPWMEQGWHVVILHNSTMIPQTTVSTC